MAVDDYESKGFHIIDSLNIADSHAIKDIEIDNADYYIVIRPILCLGIDRKYNRNLQYFIDICEFLIDIKTYDKNILLANREKLINYRKFTLKHKNNYSYILKYSITKNTVLYNQVKRDVQHENFIIDGNFDSFDAMLEEMADSCLSTAKNNNSNFRTANIYSCNICISLHGEIYSNSLVDKFDMIDIIERDYKIISTLELAANGISLFNPYIITIGDYTFNIRPVSIYAVKEPGYFFGFMYSQFEINDIEKLQKLKWQFLNFLRDNNYCIIIYEYEIVKKAAITDEDLIRLFNGTSPIAIPTKKSKKKKNKKSKAKTYVIEELDENDNVINTTEEPTVEEPQIEEIESDEDEPEIQAIIKYTKQIFASINTNQSLIVHRRKLVYYFNYLAPIDEQETIKRKFDYLYRTNHNFKSKIDYFDEIVILKGIHLDFSKKTNSLHITFRLYGKYDASNVLHAYLNSIENIVSITEVIDWLN
jgi:hypothetical protein